MLDKDCLKFGNMEFEESESEWFQIYSEMIILSLNVSFNTILSTDIYVALEQELCFPSRSEYIRLIAIILDLPSEYD